MGRNYGLNELETYISREDFREGCVFNLWMGIGLGIVMTVVTELVFLWVEGILL